MFNSRLQRCLIHSCHLWAGLGDDRLPGPRTVKVVSFSKSGNHRATVKKMLDLGLDYIPTNVVTMDGVRGGAERAAGASASRPTHPD